MSAVLAKLAAAYHGDQIVFVQENSPGTSVFGAFWFKPSTEQLRVWFNDWILVTGGVSSSSVDTVTDVSYDLETHELKYTKVVNTYENGVLVSQSLPQVFVVDAAEPCGS